MAPPSTAGRLDRLLPDDDLNCSARRGLACHREVPARLPAHLHLQPDEVGNRGPQLVLSAQDDALPGEFGAGRAWAS
jgi:hypothetical protein